MRGRYTVYKYLKGPQKERPLIQASTKQHAVTESYLKVEYLELNVVHQVIIFYCHSKVIMCLMKQYHYFASAPARLGSREINLR
jgi:hypothetical protein